MSTDNKLSIVEDDFFEDFKEESNLLSFNNNLICTIIIILIENFKIGMNPNTI